MVLQTIFRGSVWVFSPCVQFRVGTKLSRLRNHSPSAHYQGWQWSIEWTTFCPQVLWVCPMKNVQLQVQEMRIWFEYLCQKFRFFKQTSGPSVVFFESNPPSRTVFFHIFPPGPVQSPTPGVLTRFSVSGWLCHLGPAPHPRIGVKNGGPW